MSLGLAHTQPAGEWFECCCLQVKKLGDFSVLNTHVVIPGIRNWQTTATRHQRSGNQLVAASVSACNDGTGFARFLLLLSEAVRKSMGLPQRDTFTLLRYVLVDNSEAEKNAIYVAINGMG